MSALHHDDYDQIVASVRAATERGGVYVHCWGGIGRTGTVAACLFLDAEPQMTAAHAFARLDELRAPTRKRRMAAPQTEVQREVIRRRAQRHR
jgi:protein-tyrosine phosphatase